MKTSEIVRLDRVGRVYRASPPQWALRGVSLHFERGSFSIVEGPSGSGKTTLLGVIAGLERASEGRVWTLGRDLAASSQAELRELRRLHVGFVFQDFRLIATLTAEENVSLAYRLRGRGRKEARAQAREALGRLGLEACLARRPAELSGGEKQRVAIARALAGDPELLLADEPTANLDSATGRETIALLRDQARRRGATVLVASHDPRLAEEADRVLRLLDGRIAGMEVRSCA